MAWGADEACGASSCINRRPPPSCVSATSANTTIGNHPHLALLEFLQHLFGVWRQDHQVLCGEQLGQGSLMAHRRGPAVGVHALNRKAPHRAGKPRKLQADGAPRPLVGRRALLQLLAQRAHLSVAGIS